MWPYVGRDIQVLDLDTGLIRHYPSQQAYAETIGYSKTIVNQWIKNPLHLPVLGRFLLKSSYDKTPWRTPTQAEREVYFKDHIVVRDPYANEEFEYANCTACAKELGIHRSVPHARCLSKGQIVFVDGLQYKRKNEKKPFRIFSKDELDNLEWRRNGEVYLAGKKLSYENSSTPSLHR